MPGCRAPVVANSGFECYLPVETTSRPQTGLRLYISRQASNLGRYVLEQALFALVGWIPSVIGVGLRAVLYRLILRMDGIAAIENGVRLRYADRISLGRNVYLDQGAYLHACPQGITLGDGTFVMHGAVLHVYNFRDLPHAFIRVGRDSLIGEYNVLRGQGESRSATAFIRRPASRSLRSITSTMIRPGRWSSRGLRPRVSRSTMMFGWAQAQLSPTGRVSAAAL